MIIRRRRGRKEERRKRISTSPPLRYMLQSLWTTGTDRSSHCHNRCQVERQGGVRLLIMTSADDCVHLWQVDVKKQQHWHRQREWAAYDKKNDRGRGRIRGKGRKQKEEEGNNEYDLELLRFLEIQFKDLLYMAGNYGVLLWLSSLPLVEELLELPYPPPLPIFRSIPYS